MTAVANKSEEEVRNKPRRFWWAKGHPPEGELTIRPDKLYRHV
jgi:hypothetical protein